MAASTDATAGTLRPLRFLTLGPLEVHADGTPLPLGPPLQRTLLAALLVEAPRSVPVVTLLHRLWGDEPPATATKSIQKYVSNLRQTLGAERFRSHGGYAVVVEPDEVDTARFETALGRARAAPSPAGAVEVLDDALACWRGEPYADLVDAAFLEPVRQRAAEARLALIEERLDALLRLGENDVVVGDTAELVRTHPFRERLWQQRAAALAATGRQGEALAALRELRSSLAEQLGIDPAPASQDLELRILSQEPTTRPVERRSGNLPAATTDVIGRDADVTAVVHALERSRLVTLTGAGGVGKSTLALTVARRRAASHASGAWLVELAAVTDPDRVAAHMAEVLGIHDDPSLPIAEHLTSHLARADHFVVIDNCEHVLDAAASLVRSLLESSPAVRIVATSRQPLGVPGEAVVPVAPLTVPPSGAPADRTASYPAVRLLIERAVAAGARFDPESSGSDLAAICRTLDGIPLALELAAPRLRAFSPAELAARLEDRLGVLAVARREGPARHRTLEATIDWSFRLLSPEEQAVFAELAAFRGGFRVEAAEAVCGGDGRDVATTVAALVDRSLLTPTPTTDGRTRFRMLDTIRRYAEERLGSREAEIRSRHARYYATLASAVQGDRSLSEPERIVTLGADYENLRAALTQLLDVDDARAALELAIALGTFWNETGRLTEGQRWLERIVAADTARDARRVEALLQLSQLHQPSSSDRPLATAREAVEIADAVGDDRLAARARLMLGRHHAVRLERDVADPLLKEALALSEREGDPLLIAECFEALGIAHRSDVDHGIPYFERAIETFRRVGADRQLAHALFSMTYRSLTTAGRFDDARAALEESLRMSLRDGSRHTAAHAIAGLGKLSRLSGDRHEAERTFRFALEEFREIGDRRCVARMLTGLALVDDDAGVARTMLREAIELALDVDPEASPEVTETADAVAVVAARGGDPEDAARWLGAVEAIREREGIRRPPPDEREMAELRELLDRQLGHDRAAALRSEGAAAGIAGTARDGR